MANKLLQQGRDVEWLCDDTTGGALVRVVATDVSLGATVTYVPLYDSVSAILAYSGKALPGTLTSAASWQIMKLVYSAAGDVTGSFANGVSTFNNIWDNRASLTYT